MNSNKLQVETKETTYSLKVTDEMVSLKIHKEDHKLSLSITEIETFDNMRDQGIVIYSRNIRESSIGDNIHEIGFIHWSSNDWKLEIYLPHGSYSVYTLPKIIVNKLFELLKTKRGENYELNAQRP